MEIAETIIGLKEINKYLVPYLNGSKSIPEDNKLEFQFSETLEAIDELFYAYLLLFKQNFSRIKIILNIPSNKPKQIAKQHIVFLNAYYPQPFISIEGENYLNIRNTTSADFIPHILVQKDTKGEPRGFEKSTKDGLSELLSSDRFKSRTDIYSIIADANKAYNQQKKKDKTKEIILAEKLKDEVSFVSKTPLRHFYRIDILARLGILENYLTENQTEILSLLKQKNFFTFSQIELYFFYLLVIQHPKRDLKKEYNNILSYFFEKTNKTYFGLKELAQNIIEHTESGLGVISARVHSKEKIDNLKNFGGSFDNWFEPYKNDNNVNSFLDINIIDAGKIGVTQKYVDKINEQINDDTTHTKVKEALEIDIKTIEIRKYGFSHFLNYQKIELLHQINRINSRIGLLLFSKTVCKDERGIVKTSSINSEENTENIYLYEDNKKELKLEESETDKTNFVQFGTNYNFILPIQKKPNIPTTSTQTANEQGVASSVLKELFDYEIINITDTVSNTEIKLEKYEKIFFYAAQVKKTSKNFGEKQIAIVNVEQLRIEDFNSSDWIRLLANISFDSKIPVVFVNIERGLYQEIINFNKIFQTCYWQNLTPILFYIKQNFPVALQPKDKEGKIIEQKLSLWFSNVLAGNTYEDYLALNKQISYYQHNLYNIQDEETEDKEVEVPITPLFVDKNLLNFELLIKKDDLTLFEHSVKSLMNLEIRTLPDKNLIDKQNVTKEERFFYKFKGYKISNSHFRLGSKLHISDYYYAKRLFYNSFYANRFAFLITKYLLNTAIDGFGGIDRTAQFTLIGYSRYSELLVSNVKRLLELQGFENINHDVMLETESTLKNPEDIKDKVIIIVPIATTFSTSIKIKKNLKDIIKNKVGNPEPEIINNKVVNILFVSDKDFDKDFDDKDNEWKENFSWDIDGNNKKIECRDKKIIPIRVKENNTDHIYNQKYFIQLESEWNLIHKCKLCFPENLENEVCLLETGKDGVSPETIFGFPVTKLDNDCDNKITAKQYFEENNKEFFIIKQHITRDNKHYKHYIKSEKFLEKSTNKKEVEEWLRGTDLELLKNKSTDSQVIFITPSRLANSVFVNMVNQHVFSDKATILQYSDTDDILQNFIRFNSSFFKDSIILFVDDVIHTATIFHKINNYIKSIPQSNSKCIDYCVSLFNRLGYFDREEVERNLSKSEKEKIISFVDINLPSVKLSNYEFPEIIKQNLFDDLSRQSVTDIMKFFFKEELNDISALDFDKEQYMPKGNSDQLFYFFVYKSLYSFFYGQYDNNSTEFKYGRYKTANEFEYTKIEQFQENKDVLLETLKTYVAENKTIEEFINYYKTTGKKVYKSGEEWIREIDYTEELETQIISIYAAPPFSLYKDIQEFAFYWVLKKLQEFVERINNAQSNSNIKFFTDFHNCENQPHCEYENFRRWLHLAATLKINYVFSVEMLKAINILFDNWTAEGIDRKRLLKSQPTDLYEIPKSIPDTIKKDFDIGFLTYYVGIIEQLTKTDEAKAIKVIQNVATLIKEQSISKTDSTSTNLTNDKIKSLTLRNNFNNKFIDCLRYLVFENTFIFNTFIEQFYGEEKRELANFNFENDTYNDFKTKIENYHKERQQARWQSLNLMLSEYNDDIEPTQDTNLEAAFYKTVYLKILLENDKNEQRITTKTNIKDKTTIILKYLTEILGINNDECKNGGAYFTVRYNDRDKLEKDIVEDDLYTVSLHCVGTEDKLEMPLTDESSVVFDLYRGIKEKNSRKPSSLIELIYKGDKYISSNLEKYYSNEEIKINENKIETNCTFDHKYNNLLFLRIADIKEDKTYKKIIEEFIEEISGTEKLPRIFSKIEEWKNIKKWIEKLKSAKINSDEDKENRDKIVKALTNIQNFPLNIRDKFVHKIKDTINSTINENDKRKKIKEILLDFKRKEIYRSYPNAVLGFYKCRLDEGKQCPKYNSENCEYLHKRFDPKRIRFLLLLRDDIGKFVERHLRNDSFSAYVNETKATVESKAGEHDYFNLLGRLADNKNDEENFKELFLLLNDRKNIRELLNTHTNILPSNNINIKQEIEKLYDIVFTNKVIGLVKEKDIDSIPDDLQIRFPLYIFKSVIYEYIFNAHKTLPDSKSKPQFSIKAKKDIDNSITITICNNFTQEINEQIRKKIEEKGYCDKNPKGLYKNMLLLQYANCCKPKFTITDNTFNVEINFKNYE
jgi:hypothetical protein